MNSRTAWRLAAAGAAIALLGACSDGAGTAPTPTTGTPGFAILYGPPPTPTTVRTVEFEYIEVCKIGSSGDFSAWHNDYPLGIQSIDFTLADGGCRETAVLSAGDGEFNVTESAPTGFKLDSIFLIQKNKTTSVIDTVVVKGTATISIDPADNKSGGWLIEFFNSPVEPPGEGCTRTIGYWKNWDGSGPQADVVTQYLPITLGSGGGKSVVVSNTTTSHAILSFSYAGGKASNGITKLYAQLLAAKLNLAADADVSPVAGTIAAADAFLALYDQGDWASLTKDQQKMVLAWMTTLDNYNNGLLGPSHCE